MRFCLPTVTPNCLPSGLATAGSLCTRSWTPKNKYDLWVFPMGESSQNGERATARKPIPFLRTEFTEWQGQLSSDSRWMAYASDVSGQFEVYVQPFPAGEGKWKISIAGGEGPRWRGDGRELFFVAADGKMMAVPVKATEGAKPSLKQALLNPCLTRKWCRTSHCSTT